MPKIRYKQSLEHKLKIKLKMIKNRQKKLYEEISDVYNTTRNRRIKVNIELDRLANESNKINQRLEIIRPFYKIKNEEEELEDRIEDRINDEFQIDIERSEG